jgi:capsular polysaccharide biosynthesis protein
MHRANYGQSCHSRELQMLSRFLPIWNLGRKVIGGRHRIEDAADQITVIQTEEIEDGKPIFHLDGQIEKVTAGSPFTPLGDEMKALHQTEAHHASVIRYTFRDCFVHQSGFDGNEFAHRIKNIKEYEFLYSNAPTLVSATYCMSPVSDMFFGHWLQDACATALLAKTGDTLFLDPKPVWPHALEYAQALRLPATKPAPSFVRRIDLYQDHGQGSNKRARYSEMRDRLSAHYPQTNRKSRLVYFRRGDTGMARIIANETSLVETLTKQGFEIFDLRNASVASIFSTFRDATTVVSVDGSHLNHLYFAMPPGSALVTLIPADRFTMNQIGYAGAAGLRYGFMVIDTAPGGYHVNEADLLRTLDLVEKSA